MQYSSKQRMLNAYKGIFSDRYPIAPEFWYYYPAKILGVDMIAFEREIPLWKALQISFKKFATDGWGCVSVQREHPDVSTKSDFQKISQDEYLLKTEISYKNKVFNSCRRYSKSEPSRTVEYFVKHLSDLEDIIETCIADKVIFNFDSANQAYSEIGEDYLLELGLGVPFFDFIAGFVGFEKAAMLFAEDEVKLNRFRTMYTVFQIELIRRACQSTRFESFFVGCSYSCNSLIGPAFWRKWDKPYIQAIADEVHYQKKLLHIHFHGKCMETVADFAEIGIDCVCPFERPPGGDVKALDGLKTVAKLLNGRTTMNGNIHTVETLIRGTPKDVCQEVQEVMEAFRGNPRVIVGTGDQVGRETPQENLCAMIEEAKRN